eukprot:TRINITY_DN73273_c0_g1_i1.p1 TRINITY_DN73273_c0_g1~~TRINITY_DN73273_c0_g1_i1.p1  ORF type:complete len:985 (+),score=200.36 TRINITY_DN73273_c0_g1_i1:26-2980(+)
MCDHATLEDAVENGIDLSSNAFMLIHGWTAGPLLMEFVASFLEPLSKQAMTLEELQKETQAQAGPLAITLRTCCILGYVDFNSSRRVYSVVQGLELEELGKYLKPSASTCKALRSVYAEAIPPFKVPSEAATHCLVVWAEHRPTWAQSASKVLPILLDGIVLAPLMTSITYFSRWSEEGLDFGKDKAMERFDFGKVDAVSRQALGDIFEELGVGAMSPKGVVSLSTRGSLALQRCYSYYVPTSYSPMLAEFHTILFEDAGWGFVDAGQDAEETEIHVERTLNVVGSGAQHQTLFKDLMRHIDVVFAGEDFQNQPKFVVDTGSGDGHLLMHIYQHVKEHTARGKVLQQHPLTMVGVDFNEESRVATAVNLTKHGIGHLVIFGDIGKPKDIMKALQKKGVDLAKTLHVRSFLDHDRPYIAPEKKLSDSGVVAEFAKMQMRDFVHLDKHGNPLTAIDLFQSLVEHFGRWGDSLEGSFGLCMLEVMMLDVPTTQRFINDCVSFHFDIVQCLSRQYMISPVAFAMGAAMAGLMPANVKNVQTYPEQGKYCRVINQHLVRRPYRFRFAEIDDMPSLLRIEELQWADNLRASSEVLKRRLETSPTSNLVCELDGKVVGVLYTQRVQHVDVVDSEKFMEISDAHLADGSVVQLIAIATDPEVSNLGLGSELRAFALHLARLDPTVETVIGVTRCRDFKGHGSSMQQYVDKHSSGKLVDPILDFHTSFGAEVVRLVNDFRPEDADNEGIGVLIQYHVKELSSLSKPGSQLQEEARTSFVPTLDLLSGIMDDLGYPLDRNDLYKGFFDYGMDSLELVRVRNKLSQSLAMDLPATLLLDFPTVKDLADQLDRDRGVGENIDSLALAAAEEDPTDDSDEHVASGWEGVTPSELLELQEKSKKVYKQPAFQKKFQEIARKCYPDMMRYILAIESVLVEVEGPILLEFGLIDALDWQTVQIGRSHMTATQIKYWKDYPEVKKTMDEILHITKQDQSWE